MVDKVKHKEQKKFKQETYIANIKQSICNHLRRDIESRLAHGLSLTQPLPKMKVLP